jgi:hypothetical protein
MPENIVEYRANVIIMIEGRLLRPRWNDSVSRLLLRANSDSGQIQYHVLRSET